MIIGIDASRANKPKKTGVEWYCFHLIQSLKKITANDGNQWILYTREPLSGGLEVLPENWYEVRAHWPPKRLWTQVRLSWEMLRRPPDVLFVPGHVLPPFRPEKSVVTIHDVGFHRLPKFYKDVQIRYHETSTRRIVKSDARIIAPSEFTGRELVDAYHADPSRIAITPLGIDHEAYKPVTDPYHVEAVLSKYHVPRPYVLFIGRLEAKKNVTGLVKAFNRFKELRGLGDPTSLILAGPQGYRYDEIKREIAASPHKDRIHEIGYVDEKDKPALLSGAAAYCQVTWYEGFGIPALEAMACACPVIASDGTSLPEVIGEGNGIFVPPDGTENFARALIRLSDDRAYADELRRRGVDRARQFTWEKTAEATLPVLTQWLGEGVRI
jgi:glycosyltransferase involved in cell wall biosynthesis